MENNLSWDQIEDLSQKLAVLIKNSRFEPDYLIGITVGGLIPLGLLAEDLGIRKILTISAGSYEGKEQKELEVTYLPNIDLSGKKLLLVDEVAETGKTLERLVHVVNEKYEPNELRTATLVLNTKESRFRPDYYALETQEWLIFPWERD